MRASASRAQASARAQTSDASSPFPRQREDRQQPVAHELEHLAAMVEDRRHLAVEILVEQVDQLLRRQPLGGGRKATHVREPDHGPDRFDVAAPDFAHQNPLARLAADIGVEQIRGGAPQGADFRDPRQRHRDRFEIGKLRGREAARLLRRPGRDVDRGVGEHQGHRDIIRRSLGAELGKNRKVIRAIAVGQMAPDRLAIGAYRGDRAGPVLVGVHQFVLAVRDGDALAGLPGEAAAEDVGMQRVDEDRGAPERDAAGDHPVTQFPQHVFGARRGPGAIRQPLDHGSDVGHRMLAQMPAGSPCRRNLAQGAALSLPRRYCGLMFADLITFDHFA